MILGYNNRAEAKNIDFEQDNVMLTAKAQLTLVWISSFMKFKIIKCCF